ncbi:polymorphic toxin type 23 domain-containing protein [Tenacibaculum maritimum]|nr:polymorphic toxin type 23 domain-containing protein [Tenacibaculum maritimum]
MGVALIHMNGRMYDAKLGHFLSPDNFIQEPFSTQSFNRFGYVWNNPLKFTDPSGEEFITVVLIGALIGATAGAMGYIINAAIDWAMELGNFGMSILGGAISGAIGGAIGPTALFKSILTNGFWGTAAIAAASSFLPSLDVKIGDFSFGLSPALAFGRATGFGVNVSVSYQDGDFTFSAGYGVTFYGTAHGTGKKGWEHRFSGSIGSNGKVKFSAYTTYFSSGETTQRVAGLSLGHGEWNIRYENDGSPFSYLGTIFTGRDSDRYRTAAMSLSYKDYGVGFNLFTGDPNKDSTSESYKGIEPAQGHPNKEGLKGGQYAGENANKYRLGAAYFSYKGYRFGRN